jgi:hypothetical protein
VQERFVAELFEYLVDGVKDPFICHKAFCNLAGLTRWTLSAPFNPAEMRPGAGTSYVLPILTQNFQSRPLHSRHDEAPRLSKALT